MSWRRQTELSIQKLDADATELRNRAEFLRQQLSDTTTALQDLLRERRELQSSLSALRDIPNEIWITVFDHCLQGLHGRRRLCFAFRIASVMRHWRDIALDLPHLWSDIALEGGITTDIAPVALGRAGDRVLDVSVVDRARSMHADLYTALNRLVAYSKRWRTLSLETYYTHDLLDLLSQTDGVQFDSLERLSLSAKSRNVGPLHFMPRAAPNLTSIFVNGFIPIFATSRSVVKLELAGVSDANGLSGTDISFVMVRGMLLALPQLEILRVVKCSFEWLLHGGQPPVTMVSLRSLTVSRMAGRQTVLVCRLIDAPLLEFLTLDGHPDFRGSDWSPNAFMGGPFINHVPYANLRAFTCANVPLAPLIDDAFFTRMPLVERLGLFHSDVTEWLGLLNTYPDVLPELQRLCIMDTSCSSEFLQAFILLRGGHHRTAFTEIQLSDALYAVNKASIACLPTHAPAVNKLVCSVEDFERYTLEALKIGGPSALGNA